MVAHIRGLPPARERTPKEESVLEVATVHFLRDGYRGASVTAMAKSSGISKESIYRYFTGKRDLFDAVVERELASYRDSFRHHDLNGAGGGDLRASLVDVLTRVLVVLTSDRAMAFRRIVLEEATRSPDLARRYHEAGAGQACEQIASVLRVHRVPGRRDSATLGRRLFSLVAWPVLTERDYCIRGPATQESARILASETADDFLKGFLI